MKKTIKAVPDYLHLSFRDFIRHFTNVFTDEENFDLLLREKGYTKVLGYSCRSLFEIIMMHYQSDDLVVATTPLHHTSFRNIIERYVKPENIHIIGMNENFNQIGDIPKLKKCDLVVITHMFGQDMDLSVLSKFKEKHNCLIVEDRVQGGSLDVKFSHDIVDVSMYSMGMDKKPIAMGGGFLYARNIQEDLVAAVHDGVESLPVEPVGKRLKDLAKKIPTYMLYNIRPVILLFIKFLEMVKIFNRGMSVRSFTMSYRKKNPGFVHVDYMFKPSNGLLLSMRENADNYRDMEKLYREKYDFFLSCFSPAAVSYYFPWYDGGPCMTPYNAMYIDETMVETFLKHMDELSISSIENPTYKMFTVPYRGETRYRKFNNGLVYLPSVANLTRDEIEYLASMVDDFYYNYITVSEEISDVNYARQPGMVQ